MKTADQIFVKIFPVMYVWRRKTSINFGSHLDRAMDLENSWSNLIGRSHYTTVGHWTVCATVAQCEHYLRQLDRQFAQQSVHTLQLLHRQKLLHVVFTLCDCLSNSFGRLIIQLCYLLPISLKLRPVIRHYDVMMMFTCAWDAKVGLILRGSEFYQLGHLRELTQWTYELELVSFKKWNDWRSRQPKDTRTMNAWTGWTRIVC